VPSLHDRGKSGQDPISEQCLMLYHAKTKETEIQAQDQIEARTAKRDQEAKCRVGKGLTKIAKKLSK